MNDAWKLRFLKARQQFIAGHFSHLNDMQKQAVLTTQGPLLLLAGAGSGKTTVLINRIANLIRFGHASDGNDISEFVSEEDVVMLENYLAEPLEGMQGYVQQLCACEPVSPWNIIAITFTNKAANEMKERLERILGAEAQDVWAMTFHSACCRILRRDIERLGYSSNFTIYDAADSERVIKDVLKQMQLDEKSFPPKLFMNLISKAKDNMQSPLDFEREVALAGDFRMEKAAAVYAQYQKLLKEANALDFDDIILLTVQLLQTQEDVLSYYQKKFKHVLIDEYQDTNHLQYLLASLLAGGWNNICVVGDDDQSIYKFRGATIENILDFEKQYPGAKVIRLEQNYRSTQAILNAANAVISNNKGRKGKTLWTQNGEGDKIHIYESFNEADEANFVSNRIFKLSKGKQFGSIAVLYRTNAQSNALEYAFKRGGIPYRIIGGTRFFDRAEVKDMLAYLSVINNRSDDLRLRRIINNPPRGIGPKTVETAQIMAAADGISLYSVICDPGSFGPLEKAVSKLTRFRDLIEECAELLDTMTLPEFYDELLVRTGYMAMLEEKNDTENRTRAENVRELRSSIVNYMSNTDEPSLNGFLEEIALYTDIEQYDAEAEAVVMMTMHSAKGLEFDHVCLVGFEEGLFPSARSSSSHDDLEEERRLCYVAITRAKKTLSISFAKQRMLYGHTSYGRASQFLAELPSECVTGNYKKTTRPELEYIPQRSNMYGDFDTYISARPKTERKKQYSSVVPQKNKEKAINVRKGDMVEHHAFGRGMVLSVLPMGNDALVEIAFDEIGTKRLMANTAMSHMKKL